MRGGREEDIVSFLQSLAASTPPPPPSSSSSSSSSFSSQDTASPFNPAAILSDFPTLSTEGGISTIDSSHLQQTVNIGRGRDAAGRFTGGFSSNPGGFFAPGCSRNMPRDENEKARLRQIKLMQRKERNKAAARKSNLNKKLMRDSLEQKSVELREENLQLQQDIRELHSRLRHFRKLYTGMHHVCQLSAQCTLAAAFS